MVVWKLEPNLSYPLSDSQRSTPLATVIVIPQSEPLRTTFRSSRPGPANKPGWRSEIWGVLTSCFLFEDHPNPPIHRYESTISLNRLCLLPEPLQLSRRCRRRQRRQRTETDGRSSATSLLRGPGDGGLPHIFISIRIPESSTDGAVSR